MCRRAVIQMRPIAPEDWRDWIVEAQRIVEDWEAASSQHLLMTASAAALIARIARGLHEAYEGGKQTAERKPLG